MILFFEDDVGLCGTYYRIRSDSFKWHAFKEGKNKGAWIVSCDIMPSGCPSNDPDDDTEITADCDPEDYFANKALHDCMIWLSSPFKADDVDVELELFVVGGRHSSDVEEKVEEARKNKKAVHQ